MLELIFNIPEQFEQAEKIGWGCRIKNLQEVKNIVVVGVGGSAITGDVIRTIFLQESSLPVLVWRDYYLPAAVTKRTLLFVISYSGNTEETLTAYQEAKRRGSQIVVITSGGKLAERARSDGFEILVVPAGMPPRSALGLLTISMLTALNRLGLCRSYKKDIKETTRLLRKRMRFWQKRATRISRILEERFPIVYSTSRLLDVSAYRWQCQLNENAKVMCHIGQLPEQNHNEIMGLGAPKFLANRGVIVALVDRVTHPRTNLCFREVIKLVRGAYSKTIIIKSEGRSALARLFSMMVLGDLVSVALAKRRGVDPMAIPRIEALKQRLAQIRGRN